MHWLTRFYWWVTDTNSCGNGPHCYQPRGYNFPSGFGGDLTEFAIIGGLITVVLGLYHHHNCHVDGCHKVLHTSLDPKVHAPACRDHHSLGHLHGRSHRTP